MSQLDRLLQACLLFILSTCLSLFLLPGVSLFPVLSVCWAEFVMFCYSLPVRYCRNRSSILSSDLALFPLLLAKFGILRSSA
ncbi:hypothetical protein M432DRAFT_132587 [Thermoascus aurantiacus ATCC 26904]